MGCAPSKPPASVPAGAPKGVATVGSKTLLGKESDGHQGKQVRVNEPEEARPGRPRSSARKSTPWIKPGDATPMDDEDEDEEEQGEKKVAISPESIKQKEQTQETICQRAKGRRATPWITPATPMDDEDEDEDEEGLGGRKVTILEDEPEYSADRVVNKRNMARKATPWLKQGDATTMDDDEDDEEGTEQRLPWYRLLCHCNGQSTAVDVSAEQKL
mmetsp:Transcript_2743/g.7852  ORF Transcript_2743/g.7852 Transcript_2743/m.7852 type:complete len:216 (+) Transcript_2743:81-728(+)